CLKKASITNDTRFEMDRMSCNLVRCRFFIEIGLTRRVCSLVKRCAQSPIFRTDFFQVERALIEARLPEILPKDRLGNLMHALSLSEKLETLYQECELFIQISAVHVELDETHNARAFASRGLELANRNGYKILAARALLLSGLACEKALE